MPVLYKYSKRCWIFSKVCKYQIYTKTAKHFAEFPVNGKMCKYQIYTYAAPNFDVVLIKSVNARSMQMYCLPNLDFYLSISALLLVSIWVYSGSPIGNKVSTWNFDRKYIVCPIISSLLLPHISILFKHWCAQTIFSFKGTVNSITRLSVEIQLSGLCNKRNLKACRNSERYLVAWQSD